MNNISNISVIIRTYTEERWQYLVDAVNSVLSQTLPPMEIIIVVDHNLKLMERIITQCSHANMVVVENHRARGSSGAWNSGIAVARGELLAFLDDDAAAAPNWLEQLISCYTDENIIGVGGAIEPNWLAGRPTWFPDEFGWVVGCTYRGLHETIAPVRNLIGCNMSFRRHILEGIGGFYEDKGLGHLSGKPVGCDETELCIRAHQHWPQAVMLHNPYAKVYHSVPATRARWSYFRLRCYLEGRSKAVLTHIVGANDSLATEYSYTLQTLPKGVLRGISDTLLCWNPAGFYQACAIVVGFVITALGYLVGTVMVHLKSLTMIKRKVKPI